MKLLARFLLKHSTVSIKKSTKKEEFKRSKEYYISFYQKDVKRIKDWFDGSLIPKEIQYYKEMLAKYIYIYICLWISWDIICRS